MSFPINTNNTRTTFEDPFKFQSKKLNQLTQDALAIISDYYYMPISGIEGEELCIEDPYVEKDYQYSWHVKELIHASTLNQFKVLYGLFKCNGGLRYDSLKERLQIIALDQGQYRYVSSGGKTKTIELKHIPLDPNQKTGYISTLIAAVRRVEATTLTILCSFVERHECGKAMLNYALWEACFHKRISDEIPKILIKSKANVNLSDHESILMQSIRSQNFDTAKTLIDLKANVNFQSKTDKQTALHLACSYAPILIDKLLQAGADPNIVDNARRTPLHVLHHERRYSQTTISEAHSKLSRVTNYGLEDNSGKTVYTEMFGHCLSSQAASTGSASPHTPQEQKQSGIFGSWF